MTLFLDYTVTGVINGMIYAAMALALVIIWRSTHVLNFAQGAMAMFTTYIAVTLLEQNVGYWWAFFAALAAGAVMGGLVERVLIRPLQGKPEINPVIVTFGLLLLLESGAGAIWGNDNRGLPTPFSTVGFVVGSTQTSFSPFYLFVVVAVVGLMLAMLALFRGTDVGLRMRASAFAPEVARLLGVRVNRMLTLGWALAAVAGALAGIFATPQAGLTPNAMDSVLLFGFAAAVVGGLESPGGAIVGGLLTGLTVSYVSGYVGSNVVSLVAAGAIIAVLSTRPEGIFAKQPARRV
jgi:branched-chain amino acid transport system permease protein